MITSCALAEAQRWIGAIIQRNGAACQILCGVTETYAASSTLCAVEPGLREHKPYSHGPGSHLAG